ncbi:hypothetical protein HanXRQr2_Chr12g0524891 [Helianthus annuus]|uniref:NLP1-9 GAF domain-containing protein n=1 Tax=Helianthus annuus TaxID=4232 RepID=A0A251SYN6_HELAN|nr:protein NLP6 [Helianthus annuus]XP_021996775.1 protein NLP6 [Helianthus annuus]KAF5776496.1 hypothetical protein HanXRQr2_Chr12g0524891 [Helianthus annuus]KAJ0504011.1 hypothetical protein HanHA89_Chr12g0454631 [Helianthus annuus]KAJ0861355.1 hypothetical protein HanPSC8_Chr12g0505741 [Helianthus annuus]
MVGDAAMRDPSRSYYGRQTFWIRELKTSDEIREVNLKIYSAFEGLKSFPFKRTFFQFWRPLDDGGGGRLVLEANRNPYAVSPYNRRLQDKYRVSSAKYLFSIDERNNNPAWIISGGPVVTAFLNRFPEVVLDMRDHQGSPLAVCGLECDLKCCVMLPVFHSASSECVGVVECSTKHPALLLPIFIELKRELERVSLSIYHVQGSWPYKTISGDMEVAKLEIEKALEIVCESHGLTLGQVWIPYEPNTCQKFLVKLSGYSVYFDDDPLSSIKDFYDKFDVISLNTGAGLAWKTLQTHQPHLCRNIYKLSDNKGVLALLSANAKSKCASFVICLRSAHTRELDYSFEFFWPCTRNHMLLLETLLLTLRNYLPSFKFASGEQLGDELFVVDVENSSLSTPIKILPGNKLSEAPKALNETRASVGFKRTGPSNLNPLTSVNNPEGTDDDDDDDEDNDLAILASYRNESLLFYLPSSSTFENVMEKLNKEFELDPARSYKVQYEVSPGLWFGLTCLESCQRMGLIKLRVLPTVREVGWRWITNT